MFGCHSGQFIRPPWKHWEDASEEIVHIQSELDWDPENPRTVAGRHLYMSVRDQLKPSHAKRLKFYCTIGTAMDFWHRTDGMFVVEPYTVCIDLKTYKVEDNESRSVIIHPPDAGTKFDFTIVGKRIARMFNKAIRNGRVWIQ